MGYEELENVFATYVFKLWKGDIVKDVLDIDGMHNAQAAFMVAAHLAKDEPSEGWIEACANERVFAELPFGSDDPAAIVGARSICVWLDEWLASDDKAENLAALKREWLRLFAGVGTPEAPSWETYYVDPNSLMLGHNTLAVRSLYKEYGVQSATQGNEPDDSLGLMMEFCAVVMGREIGALEAGDEVDASKHALFLESFLVTHVLPWISAWRYLVEKHATSAYYQGVGELIFELLRLYSTRFAIAYDEAEKRFVYESV